MGVLPAGRRKVRNWVAGGKHGQKARKLFLILDLKRPLGAHAILNVSIAAKVRVRCISRSGGQSTAGFPRNRPTLRPQPKTATQSGATQVDWIIDLVAGLESPPLSLRTSPSSTLFQQAAPHPFLQEAYLFTHKLYILERTSQQPSSSRNRALSTGLISLILSLSQSPFVTELPPNLTLFATLRYHSPSSPLPLPHHKKPHASLLNGPAPVPRLSKPLVFHLFPLATILSNTTETST